MMAKVHILWYLLRVRLALTGSRQQKKKLLAIVTASVREFASENPCVDYRTLAERFGEPQKIAESCVAEMEPEELLKAIQIREKILMILACATVVLVTMRFCFNVASYLSFKRDVNGYAVVEIIEIERETFPEGE